MNTDRLLVKLDLAAHTHGVGQLREHGGTEDVIIIAEGMKRRIRIFLLLLLLGVLCLDVIAVAHLGRGLDASHIERHTIGILVHQRMDELDDGTADLVVRAEEGVGLRLCQLIIVNL